LQQPERSVFLDETLDEAGVAKFSRMYGSTLQIGIGLALQIAGKLWDMSPRKHPSKRAFTLVEIMIVVAIIALLAAIAVPGFLRARKRAQASRILNDLRLIDSAIDMYAIETNKATGATVNVTDWTNYLKKNSTLWTTGKDLLGYSYGSQTVDSLPKISASTWASLSDVADASFWSPYGHL
jgi:prepilin-type N-terminal cleavage/methylation domain-containing protein